MSTPQELADRYKRSGAFDALRKSLMQSFLTPDNATTENAQLLAKLDALLPPILAQPAVASKTRKQQIELLNRAVDKNAVLFKSSATVEANLRSSDPDLEGCGKRLGERIQAELVEILRISRGEAPPQPRSTKIEDAKS